MIFDYQSATNASLLDPTTNPSDEIAFNVSNANTMMRRLNYIADL